MSVREYMHIFSSLLLHMFSFVVLCVYFIGCAKTIPENVKPDTVKPFSYEQHKISIGTATHQQTVLTGFLLGGDIANLVVVSADKNKARKLHIYTFTDNQWTLSIDTKLSPQVQFVDIAKIGGHDKLITYQPGCLSWFDTDSLMERELMRITTNFKPINVNEIPHIDITRDLNNDGLDDIILPDVDGFLVATQLKNGTFTASTKLGPPDPFLDEISMDDGIIYRDVGINRLTVLWYLSRFHQMDYNQDGRNDIVFWNRNHFDVYLQNTNGRFSTTPVTFTTDVPFDTDGAYSIAFGFSGENMFSLIFGFRETTERRVLHTFRDMNGDGVADMVIHSLRGRSIGKYQSIYEVYFGTSTKNGIVFDKDIGTTIKPRGQAGALMPWGYSSVVMQDFDGNGEIDVMFSDVKTAVTGMTRAMVGKSIAIDLEFHRMKDGKYPDKPATKRKIRPKLDIFETKRVFFPAVLLGDVTGNGRMDLLVGKNWNEMQVFLGIEAEHLFLNRPQKMKINMPEDERNIKLVNINKDNKKDILIYHRSNTEPHQLTLLISK